VSRGLTVCHHAGVIWCSLCQISLVSYSFSSWFLITVSFSVLSYCQICCTLLSDKVLCQLHSALQNEEKCFFNTLLYVTGRASFSMCSSSVWMVMPVSSLMNLWPISHASCLIRCDVWTMNIYIKFASNTTNHLTFLSQSETFVRGSFFSSSSNSCDNSDVTWQEIGRVCGSVCSCSHPGSQRRHCHSDFLPFRITIVARIGRTEQASSDKVLIETETSKVMFGCVYKFYINVYAT